MRGRRVEVGGDWTEKDAPRVRAHFFYPLAIAALNPLPPLTDEG